MIAQQPGADPRLVALFAASGIAFGWSYFMALRRGVAACAANGFFRRCVGWLLARLAAAVLFFGSVAHWGAWPLAAAFLGFLAARQVAILAARRAA
ncbi:MAG TPA: hypothetical protein VND24_06265 [Steroidobacteraceae bacterium]|nr:hypothetical protein [Steroidobacteraceae bacterium]